jgi:hypothetical protein
VTSTVIARKKDHGMSSSGLGIDSLAISSGLETGRLNEVSWRNASSRSSLDQSPYWLMQAVRTSSLMLVPRSRARRRSCEYSSWEKRMVVFFEGSIFTSRYLMDLAIGPGFTAARRWSLPR